MLKTYRICYRMETYVEADSEEGARAYFEASMQWSNGAEFVEILTVEEEEPDED